MKPLGRPTFVVRIEAERSTAERLANCLAEHFDGAAAAIGLFENLDDRWTVEICFQDARAEDPIRDIVADALGAAAAETLRVDTLADRDWIRSSLAGLQPVEAGRFLVHGSHDRQRVASNRIGIEIEAALAFGTGHHGTTRACLMAFDRILKAQRPRRVLDVGTGTGILAIAAAKALRTRVLASDIDPVAVRTARANARSNGVGDYVEVVRAHSVTDRRFGSRAPVDLVFANILLNPLQRIAAHLPRLLAPKGYVILSGLLPTQGNAALAAYAAHGLRLERRMIFEGWATIVLRRP